MTILLYNHPIIYLNHLLYMNNMYCNQSRSDKEFPHAYFEIFKFDVNGAWNFYLRLYAGKQKQHPYDVLWDSYKNEALRYFEVAGDQAKKLDETLDSFHLWWWLKPCGGKDVLEMFSDNLMSDINDELGALTGGNKLRTGQIALFFLYDDIPEGLSSFAFNCGIFSIKELLQKNGAQIHCRQAL